MHGASTPTPAEIKAVYESAGLKRWEAARLIGVPLDTFTAWLRPTTSRSRRDMPLPVFELLRIKVARLQQAAAATHLKTVNVTQARAELGALINEVLETGEPVAIRTRMGRAILLPESRYLDEAENARQHYQVAEEEMEADAVTPD